MKGLQIENRAIMFLGARPITPRDTRDEIETHGYVDEGYQKRKVSFKNQKATYWKSNMYCRIWTFKGLIKWARKLPGGESRCLEYKVPSGWSVISKE